MVRLAVLATCTAGAAAFAPPGRLRAGGSAASIGEEPAPSGSPGAAGAPRPPSAAPVDPAVVLAAVGAGVALVAASKTARPRGGPSGGSRAPASRVVRAASVLDFDGAGRARFAVSEPAAAGADGLSAKNEAPAFEGVEIGDTVARFKVSAEAAAAAAAALAAAPAPAAVAAGGFAIDQQLGVQAPFGFWDPAGFCDGATEEEFKRLRSCELKHGRISMLASIGYVYPFYAKLPGFLSPSKGISFESMPQGLAAVSKVPAGGWIQILILCVVIEFGLGPDGIEEYKTRGPGDYDKGFLGMFGRVQDPEKKKRSLNAEIANGRLAMMAITGMIVQEGITGGTGTSMWFGPSDVAALRGMVDYDSDGRARFTTSAGPPPGMGAAGGGAAAGGAAGGSATATKGTVEYDSDGRARFTSASTPAASAPAASAPAAAASAPAAAGGSVIEFGADGSARFKTDGKAPAAAPAKAAPAAGAAPDSGRGPVGAGGFNPAAQLGVQAPFGYWDPAGFCDEATEDDFKRLRSCEIKHGRISMLASIGYVYPFYAKLPGFLSPSKGISFAEIPQGFAAVSKVPAGGWIQILIFCVLIEFGLGPDGIEEYKTRAPGDYDKGFLGLFGPVTDPAKKQRSLNAEIANGRLAMMAITGMVIQEGVTGGTDAAMWFGPS